METIVRPDAGFQRVETDGGAVYAVPAGRGARILGLIAFLACAAAVTLPAWVAASCLVGDGPAMLPAFGMLWAILSLMCWWIHVPRTSRFEVARRGVVTRGRLYDLAEVELSALDLSGNTVLAIRGARSLSEAAMANIALSSSQSLGFRYGGREIILASRLEFAQLSSLARAVAMDIDRAKTLAA